MTTDAIDTLNERLTALKEQEAIGAKAVQALGILYAQDPDGSLENAQALFIATTLFLGADPQMAALNAQVLSKKLETSGIAQWHSDLQQRIADLTAAVAALEGDSK